MMGYGHPAAAYGQPPVYQSGRGTSTGENPFGAGAQSVYDGQSTYGGIFQPTPSRPTTNSLGDTQDPMSTSPDWMQGGPSDGELEHSVRAILAEADLNMITEREIRGRLEERFGTNLYGRKAVINTAINPVLLEHL